MGALAPTNVPIPTPASDFGTRCDKKGKLIDKKAMKPHVRSLGAPGKQGPADKFQNFGNIQHKFKNINKVMPDGPKDKHLAVKFYK